MRRENGWTLPGLLFTIIVIVLLALLVMKLFPPYMDNLKIKEALNVVAAEEDVRSLTKNQIIQRMDNILYIDFAHEVVDLKKALKMQKTNKQLQLSVNYEVVVPLVYNLNALIDFKNQADVSLGQ